MTLTPALVCSLILIGMAIGTISGMLGIGGAVIIIPVLMFVYHFPQLRANGTSMAILLPPIGIFAVITYQKSGNIDWGVAGLTAIGFALGAYVGGLLVNTHKIPEDKLRFMFAALLLYVAGRMIFQSSGQVMAALQTCGLMFAFGGAYVAMRLMGRKWASAPYWPREYQDRSKLPTQHDYEI